MREIDIGLKITESNVTLPKYNNFVEIGDLTALRQDSNSNFYRSNYKRGELLYALITQYKPKTIVEFGTGRGYGALCMAKAITDSNLDSYIYTIDYRNDDEKQLWPIDFGGGPKIIEASIKEIWTKFLPKECIDRENNVDNEFNAHQSGGRVINFDDNHILLTIDNLILWQGKWALRAKCHHMHSGIHLIREFFSSLIHI